MSMVTRSRLWMGSAVLGLFLCAIPAQAATLKLSPDTGIYSTGATFSVRVVSNTQGDAINAAEGEISFNPATLSVVSISKSGSIFSLWTREPEFSNTTGKIYFGGGSPSGYTGSLGTIMTVTFRAKNAGTANVSYAAGSILAADGRGTNILSSMQSGAYTIQAQASTPPPEYIPPANTPLAPKITSSTHPSQDGWYKEKQAVLSWTLPSGITGARTLLDTTPGSIPTKVYEEPLSTITLPDLPEGVSYFHIQLRNADGWGRIAHYRLGVDTQKPESFTITPAPDNDASRKEQKFVFDVKDTSSGAQYFMVQLNGGERVRFESKDAVVTYTTPALDPGDHTLVVEAFDFAGNSIVSSHSFTIDAFEAPRFTEYPDEVSSAVIPVIRGETRPNATVRVTLLKDGVEPKEYEVSAGENGVFTFIPEGKMSEGVYTLKALATDAYGAQSAESDAIRIAVQTPGLIRIGSLMVSVLSIVVPLIGLIVLLMFMVWYGIHRMRLMRRRLRKEVIEAEESLVREFDGIVASVKKDVEELKEARKGKLTKQEEELVSSLARNLESAEKRIEKEIRDIERIIKR